MSELSVGISLLLATGVADHPAWLGAFLDSFEAPSWGRPLRNFSSISRGGRDYPRRPGLVRIGERRGVLEQMLVHDDLWQVTLASAPLNRSSKEFASLNVDTRVPLGEEYALVEGRQWLSGDIDGDAWAADMLRLAEAVGARHGVVPVMESRATFSECGIFELTRDGVTQHPFPEELHRMIRARRELGSRYVRFPRWGTIYSRAHVDALGGVERIRDAVRPAVVRELGAEALYFQLTGSVATAMSAEALSKQQAFTNLAAPLLPPVVA